MKQKRENMTDKNKNKLGDLKAEHGDIAVISLDGGDYYFRRPSLPEYQRCSDKLSAKGSNVTALKELCFACSVGEDPNGALTSLPAAATQIGLALLEMAGSEIEVTISKA